jgi:prevent-host-death family protein
MKRIGIRELRQHASVWLRKVEAGESFEVTNRGRPIALLVPRQPSRVIERLTAEGRLSVAEGDLLALGEPLPPKPGVPLPSKILEQMRADER